MIGETINGYTITRKLSEGGMAIVYCAQDKAGRIVAIKVLKDEIAKDQNIRFRFRQEADIMASLDDVPGVRKIYERVETRDGRLAIIMEYLEGTDLNEYVKKKGPFTDISAVKRICEQILITLEEAHKRGIIHRDIKPSNLFYTQDGDMKILDFGISKMLFSNDPHATEPDINLSKQMGTLAYMSPEQVRSERDIDNRTDIYSLGLTLFYLLTGDDPSYFEADSLSNIGDKQLIMVIRKATRKALNKRIQSCEEFLNELNQENIDIAIDPEPDPDLPIRPSKKNSRKQEKKTNKPKSDPPTLPLKNEEYKKGEETGGFKKFFLFIIFLCITGGAVFWISTYDNMLSTNQPNTSDQTVEIIDKVAYTDTTAYDNEIVADSIVSDDEVVVVAKLSNDRRSEEYDLYNQLLPGRWRCTENGYFIDWEISMPEKGMSHLIVQNKYGQIIQRFTSTYQLIKTDNGIICEEYSTETSTYSSGWLYFNTSNQLSLTIINNGNPSMRGAVRYYYRQ